MNATRLADGSIRIPKRAEADGVIGDGFVTIGPDDPDFAKWDEWLKTQEAAGNANPGGR